MFILRFVHITPDPQLRLTSFMMSLQTLSTIILILDLFAIWHSLLNLCSGFDYDCATVPACFFLLQPCMHCIPFQTLEFTMQVPVLLGLSSA